MLSHTHVDLENHRYERHVMRILRRLFLTTYSVEIRASLNIDAVNDQKDLGRIVNLVFLFA